MIHRSQNSTLGALIGALPLLFACSQPATHGATTTSGGASFHVAGVAQKGPFEAGATVTLQELDNQLNPTGQTFTVETTDNSGSFSIPPAVSSQFIEVIINGLFFDEVWANAQPTPASLHAYADLQANQGNATVNVNLITHLQGLRLHALVQGGSTFAQAQLQSTQEVLAAFGIPNRYAADFTQATLTAGDDGSAILLAASVVLLKAAYSGNTSTVEAQAVELIDQFRLTMASGAPSATIAAEISAVEAAFTCSEGSDAVQRLTTYYAGFGITFPAPPVMSFIDTGWTGTINGLRDAGLECCPVADAGNDCSGACVDFFTDPGNCGTCGAACAAGGLCLDGGCGCPLADAGNLEAACNDACTDLQNDLGNCGGCGLICDTGCSSGECLVPLATQQGLPGSMAVDGKNVYWTDYDTATVMSVPIDGGSPATLWTAPLLPDGGGVGPPTFIAVDPRSVYWLTNSLVGPIMRAQLDGGGVATIVAATSDHNNFALDPDWIYWLEYGEVDGGVDFNSTIVMKALLDGGSPTIITTAAGGPGFIAVDSDWVYWTSFGIGANDGSVMKALLDGGDLTTLVPDTNALLISLNGGLVLFSTFIDGSPDSAIMSVLADGGGIATVASGPWQAAAMAVDATSVYWATDPGGFVGNEMKALQDGGGLVTFASQPSHGIAVDATSVYWTVALPDAGTVLRLTPK